MRQRQLNILLTCVDRRVDLLGAFRTAMGELHLAGKLVATDTSIASAVLHAAESSAVVPSPEEISYVPALLELVKEHEVGLVVPLSDLDLALLAGERGRFSEIGCTVMTGSYSSVALCRDNARFQGVCEQAGVAAVRTLSLAEFESEPFYPCFLKPTRKSARTKPHVIRNPRELRAHVALCTEPVVIQQHVSGQKFRVDVYRSRDQVVRCVVPRRELATRAGAVDKAAVRMDPHLIDETRRLTAVLGDLWGVFCCHCIRGEDGAVNFLGVDPRFDDGAVLSIAAGANLPRYLLEEVLDLPGTAEAGKVADGMLMLRHDNAVFVEADDPSALPGYQTPSFE
jgi:carbamoyl-phosphate synthase large subunit